MRVDVIAFVIGVVLMVVGLAVSIALHELGHLVPAKKFGVRVGQYMIGFGPTLWSKRIGETQYGFKAIPLGGYISMAGHVSAVTQGAEAAAAGHRSGRAGGGFFATMVQDARTANDETLAGRDDDRVFYKLPVWKRVIIMLGGPVMNFLFAIVLFAILLTRHRRADRDHDGGGAQRVRPAVIGRDRVRSPAIRRLPPRPRASSPATSSSRSTARRSRPSPRRRRSSRPRPASS